MDEERTKVGMDQQVKAGINDMYEAITREGQGATPDQMLVDQNGVFSTGMFHADVKVLPAQKVAPYLDRLAYRLDKTKGVVNDTRFSLLIDRITREYAILQLMYKSQKDGYTKLPFAIDPTDSGLPHSGNFQFIITDKQKAVQTLKQIGSVEDILRRASDKITRMEFPSEEQALLAEHEYNSQLATFEPIRSLEIGNIVSERHKEDDDRFYKMEWSGVDSRFSGLLLYKMNFSTGSKEDPAHDKTLNTVLEQNFWQPLDLVFFNIDNSATYVHPKKITRFTIGPYYTVDTINDPIVDKMFADYLLGPGGKEDDPFLLKITKEVVESIKTIPRTRRLLSRLFIEGKNTTEVASSVKRHDYWLTNFRLKQLLAGSNGEYADFKLGDFNDIIGLTTKGDLA